ncbi:MAG: hypothetical protein PHY09_15010 [Desulfuromonadaceae bacterium]|nr:hypothetical protein [Desulfuromonadaceae bacterium]MDD5105785.1 hypothetical protein [Desulfuromonadaceae bacterium]
MINLKRGLHIKHILKISVVIVAGIMATVLLCLAFLPTLVSTSFVQTRIQKALAASMKRQVEWSNLAMTWSDGLVLSGLKLGDGPAPLLTADIRRLVIIPGISRGTDGHLGVDFVVRIHTVLAQLAPGPPKTPPPPPTKDPLTVLAETIEKMQGLDFPLPLDLRVQVEIAPVQITYRVPAPGKQLQLQDFSCRLAMPSLAAKPVAVEMNGRVVVDGRDMGIVTLTATVSDLVTKARRIHIASALFAVDASAPGTTLSVSGGLSHADGFAARWQLDLPQLLAMAHPFVPATVPILAGTFDLNLKAKADAQRDLHATVTLDGSGLVARGGSLKTKQIGPLDVKLQQQIATSHAEQKVVFPGGSISVPGLIDAEWSASVNRPTAPDRSIEARLGPLRLDLARARAVAAPFLPPDTPVKELTGEIFLRSASLRLNGPENSGELAASGFGISLPYVRIALQKGMLTADTVDLLLENVTCPLTAKQPNSVTAKLRWSIGSAVLSGAEPLILSGARGAIGAVVSNLNLKSSSPRTVAATMALSQSCDLDRVASGTQFVLEHVQEQLSLQAQATERGTVEAKRADFSLTAASLKGSRSGKRFGPLPFSASLTAEDTVLAAEKGARPTVRHAAARVSAGDFFHLTADAALSSVASTTGSMRLDLQRALPAVARFVPSGLTAGGVVSATWNLAAPLTGMTPADDTHLLRRARSSLERLDKLDIAIKLDDVSATVPSAQGAFRISGLRTAPDLRIVVAKKGESARCAGNVLFSGLSGLTGPAEKFPPQHGSLALSGDLADWSRLRLHEELRIDPLALSHEAELNVSRLDALLNEEQPFNRGTLLKRLDATLFASLDATFSPELKPLLPGINTSGRAAASLRADLTAGRELALRCALNTSDFSAQMANGTTIEGMRSDISFNRIYVFDRSQADSWTPLSRSLVRPEAVSIVNTGAKELVERVHDDLRGDVTGSRSFSIRRVVTMVSGSPLELTALEGDLLLTREKTGINFFQADLLGGTVLASSLFDLKQDVPVFSSAGSFSNLDITYLLPPEARSRQADQDAEITGELAITAPLTVEQRTLLEQLHLTLNVRKIGANTIERALFALDPYERNEQVVAQRKILKLGRLKGLRATARDGAFSMEGEAQIKGVAVDLPKVERLRISELPHRQELEKNSTKIAALRGILDLMRADTLVIGSKGELSLQRRMYEQ